MTWFFPKNGALRCGLLILAVLALCGADAFAVNAVTISQADGSWTYAVDEPINVEDVFDVEAFWESGGDIDSNVSASFDYTGTLTDFGGAASVAGSGLITISLDGAGQVVAARLVFSDAMLIGPTGAFDPLTITATSSFAPASFSAAAEEVLTAPPGPNQNGPLTVAFAVPEPGRALLMVLALGACLVQRKRSCQ